MGRGGRIAVRMLAAAAAFSAAIAEDSPDPHEIITSLKAFERSRGFPETGSFIRPSRKASAAYRCYFTGKFELPASYDGLRVRDVTASGCAVDERKYDLFFYPIEAVASGRSQVTSSLLGASVERLLMVVLHEDLHNSRELERLDSAIGEAATTLVGFRLAADFARERFGETSETYRNLSREAEFFLAKAEIVNRYWRDLAALYAGVRAGRTRPDEALAIKERTFARLRQECLALDPQPASFNACPAANNNAGLAFDATYTRYYPLVYEINRLQGDSRLTLQSLGTIGRGVRDNAARRDLPR